jgi:hypothetical protein
MQASLLRSVNTLMYKGRLFGTPLECTTLRLFNKFTDIKYLEKDHV